MRTSGTLSPRSALTHAHVGGEDAIICVTNSVVTSLSAARPANWELPVEYRLTGLICTGELCGLVVDVVEVSSCLPLAWAAVSGAKQLATRVAATRHVAVRLSTELSIGAGSTELSREFLLALQGIR